MGEHEEEAVLADWKMKKSRSKAVFTRYKNRMLDYCASADTKIEEFTEQLDKVEEAMDKLTGIIEGMVEFLKKAKRTEEIKKCMSELEEIEHEYDKMLKSYRSSIDKEESDDEESHEDSKKKLDHDMYKQLKRVSIPVFTGKKKEYEFWNSAFKACVDETEASAEYKFLQLRQYLGGEALKCIEGLGHSEAAYEAAKERLERRFGGKRRQISRFIEEIDNFPVLRNENPKMIEKYADLLDIAIINMKEKDDSDLSSNFMYIQLLKKLPETMIVRFQRWLTQNSVTESIEVLKDWVVKEAEYQNIAVETRSGLDNNDKPEKKFHRSYFAKESSKQCKLCDQMHNIWNCDNFKRLDVPIRWEKAKELNLCFRCLGDNHRGSRCNRSRKCGVNGCNKLHNRLLHNDTPNNSQVNLNENAQEFVPRQSQNQQQTYFSSKNMVALRTVPVILSANGKRIKINALLDDGSTKTYINQDVVSELGLNGEPEVVQVNVLNGRVENMETMTVNFEINSVHGDFKANIEASTTKSVTGKLKPVDWNEYSHKWPHLANIKFPTVNKKDKINLLIGSDNSLLHSSRAEVNGKPGEPVARLTPLGWTCIGNLGEQTADTGLFTFHAECQDLNLTLKQFWEIENVDSQKLNMSLQDIVVEEKTNETLNHKDNRYIVSIPWKEKKELLPVNYSNAVKRLANTERKLQKDENLKRAYTETIEKYVNKGYVKKIANNETEKGWYLPHFPVVKPDRETTKVRIVFDASAKYEQVSLNDYIHPGPKLQRELFDVLLRFRKKPVALVCDIAEMYLQIGLNSDDQPYHRFLWRESPEKPIEMYQFTRLVFGINASPYLAQFVSRHNAVLYAEQYPLAAETVLNSTYMDDSLDSANNENEAIELYEQLSALWGKANMCARKWMSNSRDVLERIPESDRAAEIDIESKNLPSTKALGLTWKAENDTFKFKKDESLKYPNDVTKRNILKTVARIFDPLGFLAPYTVRAKVIMQNVWLSGIDWDETANEDIERDFSCWFNELSSLNIIDIPRCIRNENCKGQLKEMQLHVFVDASTIAYGAIGYFRSEDENSRVTLRFVAAKSKVAPLESTSIPRLELLAAMLGLKLGKAICRALEIDIKTVIFWSDSMNVLFWIRNQSRQFKTFVANRIGEIHKNTDPQQWRYVPSKDNPADIVSRGISLCEIAESRLWWQGPEYLKLVESEWPVNKVEESKISKEEIRKATVMNFNIFQNSDVEKDSEWRLNPERYSNWHKLVRVFAWVVRFLENCKLKKNERIKGALKAQEIEERKSEIIKETQKEYFREEYDRLTKNKNVQSSSKLIKYNPKIDVEGVLRCDGRLKYAEYLPYDTRYPIILPRKSPVTRLLVRDIHERNNHSGTNQTLSDLSVRYCVIAAREEIRDCENNCSECRRRKSKPSVQIMAPLPKIRLNMPLRAFAHTAVDYGGPYITVQGRGRRREKRYMCLFTCLATRAVHLEMAFGLDTNSFLNAFYRMVNRRGLPVKMLSDNGTNFIGAEKELRDLVSQLDKDQIEDNSANKGVQWQFNPPLAPHWGGVHESMVKSAKRALVAIVKNADLTDEELMTAFTGVEGLLNSRPLTYHSTDPTDCPPLTPNHFLFGQIGGQFAPQSVDETQFNPIKRWRRVQELVNHFWKRWIKEWLPRLNVRSKWFNELRDLQVGDVVLVIVPDSPRGRWPLGRVTKIHNSEDGHVRAATVLVSGKEFTRPIVKLCRFELDVPNNVLNECSDEAKCLGHNNPRA